MQYDLLPSRGKEPGRFWHVNDDCDVRVDTFSVRVHVDAFFCFSKGCGTGVLVFEGVASLYCPSEGHPPDPCCRSGHLACQRMLGPLLVL